MGRIMKLTVKQSVDHSGLENITQVVVEQNAELIALTISNGTDTTNILNTYSDRLTSLLLRDYDKARLLDLISSGVLFTLRETLNNEIINHPIVKRAIAEKESAAV